MFSSQLGGFSSSVQGYKLIQVLSFVGGVYFSSDRERVDIRAYFKIGMVYFSLFSGVLKILVFSFWIIFNGFSVLVQWRDLWEFV